MCGEIYQRSKVGIQSMPFVAHLSTSHCLGAHNVPRFVRLCMSKLAYYRAALGEFHFMFKLHTHSPTDKKQTVEATVEHNQEARLTICSPSVCMFASLSRNHSWITRHAHTYLSDTYTRSSLHVMGSLIS